jgi:hypothetical protein
MWFGGLFLATVGCAMHASITGLVEPLAARPVGEAAATPVAVAVLEYNGRRTPLLLDAESVALRRLEGCIVEVSGMRTPVGLWVRDWYVKDAGDGSSGFVGVLRVHGSRVLLDDRNTHTVIALDEIGAVRLRPYVGRSVLVVGGVVGSGIVQVVAWRLLDEAPPR